MLEFLAQTVDVVPANPTTPDVVTWSGVPAMFLVSGVVQALHKTNLIPDNFVPILGVFLGVTGGIVVALSSTTLSLLTGSLQGVMVGLGASGLWNLFSGNGQRVVTEKVGKRLDTTR